jgi:hypothetical protein
MTFKELMDRYVHDLDNDDMEHLTHKIDWFVEEVREKDSELADKFLMKVDLLINPHFTRDTAEYVVSKFENKDGTTGEHWDYETTTKVLDSKGYDFRPCDWYVALNMIYSDFYRSGRSDETYIEMAYDFLNDKDAPDDKMKRYYKAMR